MSLSNSWSMEVGRNGGKSGTKSDKFHANYPHITTRTNIKDDQWISYSPPAASIPTSPILATTYTHISACKSARADELEEKSNSKPWKWAVRR
nr:hypothetical transcript [Hymenolepis microstoma]